MKKGYTDLSEEKVKRATGKSTKVWAKIPDKFDVKKNGYTLAAKFLREKHRLNPWWSQVVVVMYEYQNRLRK